MSLINRVSGQGPLQSQPARGRTGETVQPTVTAASSGQDTVTISSQEHYLSLLRSNNVRSEKIANIRKSIDNGTYDQDGTKLNEAVDRLLDEVSA